MIKLLEMIPAAAYVAFFTALLTGGITLFGIFLTNKGNTGRLKAQLEHERLLRKEELYRKQVEELYLLLEGWLNSLLMYFLPYMGVMKGEITYNDALDQTISLGSKKNLNYKRLEMLIDIYFHELQNDFSTLLDKRSQANEIIFKHKSEYERGITDGQKILSPLIAKSQEIDELGNIIKENIINIAKNV